MISFEGNFFIVNGKEIAFNNKIDEVIYYEGLYVVFLMENRIPSNNIFAINEAGDVLWNIKDIVKLPIDESYVTASKINNNELKVISASGIRYSIDVYTKEIIMKQIIK